MPVSAFFERDGRARHDGAGRIVDGAEHGGGVELRRRQARTEQAGQGERQRVDRHHRTSLQQHWHTSSSNPVVRDTRDPAVYPRGCHSGVDAA